MTKKKQLSEQKRAQDFSGTRLQNFNCFTLKAQLARLLAGQDNLQQQPWHDHPWHRPHLLLRPECAWQDLLCLDQPH